MRQGMEHVDDPGTTFTIDLALVLPEAADEREACVDRLISLLEDKEGVDGVHVLLPGPEKKGVAPQLCLHYDAERITLGNLTSLIQSAGANVRDSFGHATFPFRSVGPEDDGQRIEDELRRLRGVTAASVSFAAQIARVEFDRSEIGAGDIEAEMRKLGLGLRPETPTAAGAAGMVQPPGKGKEPKPGWYRRNTELAWSIIAGALMVAARFAFPEGSMLSLGLYVVSYFFGSRDNVGHFLKDLRRGRFHFNIDLLMVVAAAGAAILGQWFEGALLLFLFSLGHALEHYALGRARQAISALAELVPQTAIVLKDGVETEKAIDQVMTGDIVVVKPGSRLPVDGVVSSGTSTANQAPITGESIPVPKAKGDQVFAGSVNGQGVLLVEVTVAIGDRTMDRVIKLVSEAQTQKAPTQQFTDRFEKIFVPVVLAGAALFMIVPPLIGLLSWSDAIMRGLTLLVAASPCALALGTPAAVLTGIAQAARRGVLIKGGAHLENLGQIEVVALDKTGTLTVGQPEVTDLVPYEGTSEDDLLGTAAAVEKRSQHPLASAIVRAAEKRSLVLGEVGEVEALTGLGIRSSIGGEEILIGRLGMFTESGGESAVPAEVSAAVARLEKAGRSTAIVKRDGAGASASASKGTGYLGVIGIADEPRASAREHLDALRRIGVKRIVMLTGDNEGVGNAIGKVVGVDEVFAGLMPEGKVDVIRKLASQGKVAMVGDGVNDAPALAHATVGIAMGGAGTAAALETADAALMGDDLGRLSFAIGISRAARRVIRQNLFVSLSVIAVLIATSLTGTVGISYAIVVHEGSTLVVIVNALRLLAYD